jgi:C1A family cysteine protease
MYFKNVYNVTIPVEDQAEAIANIKAAKAQIERNNLLFAQNKSNYESAFYPHNAYTNRQLQNLYGDSDSFDDDVSIAGEEILIESEVFPEVDSRFKRSVDSDPRCQNLPSYINWVEEGKTTPVKDQKKCGKTLMRLHYSLVVRGCYQRSSCNICMERSYIICLLSSSLLPYKI